MAAAKSKESPILFILIGIICLSFFIGVGYGFASTMGKLPDGMAQLTEFDFKAKLASFAPAEEADDAAAYEETSGFDFASFFATPEAEAPTPEVEDGVAEETVARTEPESIQFRAQEPAAEGEIVTKILHVYPISRMPDSLLRAESERQQATDYFDIVLFQSEYRRAHRLLMNTRDPHTLAVHESDFATRKEFANVAIARYLTAFVNTNLTQEEIDSIFTAEVKEAMATTGINTNSQDFIVYREAQSGARFISGNEMEVVLAKRNQEAEQPVAATN